MEYRRTSFRIDLAVCGGLVLALAIGVWVAGPAEQRLTIALSALAGLASWTAIEYVLHRFVLHGLKPLQRWHAEHHRQPAVPMYPPILLSAALIFSLALLPFLILDNPWAATALALGVLSGYLAYAITHHAIHHGPSSPTWLRARRWHGLHHHSLGYGRCYGVTSRFWDHVCGSAIEIDRT